MILPRSLQGRLLLLLLGLVSCVWLTTAALTWRDAQHELDELLDSHLAQAAALLVVQQTSPADGDDHVVDAPTLHRYAPKVAFQVFHEGRLVLQSANAPAEAMAPPGERFETGFATVSIGGHVWRVFATRGDQQDVRVYVGERVDSRHSILWAVLRSVLWPMAVALPLLALAIWWVVRYGVAPLKTLGRTLAVRDPRRLEPVTMPSVPREVAPVLDALNRLFERIGAMVESERRFTADAAHELRTPIAAIRTQAQVALAETDDALRRHALLGMTEGCDRAARLVDQLLTLSRLEGGAAASMSPVDLAVVARRVLAELAPLTMDRRQSLELANAQPCPVRGNELLLAVLVRNLVDNASRYSPEGARIQVTVAHRDTRTVLAVEDSGPGLSAADRNRLGERFFRVLGTDQSGSGLGWSIVQRIAAAHGAELSVGRSAILGGLDVSVAWPALKETQGRPKCP